MMLQTLLNGCKYVARSKVNILIATFKFELLLIKIEEMILHAIHGSGFSCAGIDVFEDFVKKESCLILDVFIFWFFKDLFLLFEFFWDALVLKFIFILSTSHFIIKETLDIISLLTYLKLQILNSLIF